MATGQGLRHFDPSAAASTYVVASREAVESGDQKRTRYLSDLAGGVGR